MWFQFNTHGCNSVLALISFKWSRRPYRLVLWFLSFPIYFCASCFLSEPSVKLCGFHSAKIHRWTWKLRRETENWVAYDVTLVLCGKELSLNMWWISSCRWNTISAYPSLCLACVYSMSRCILWRQSQTCTVLITAFAVRTGKWCFCPLETGM